MYRLNSELLAMINKYVQTMNNQGQKVTVESKDKFVDLRMPLDRVGQPILIDELSQVITFTAPVLPMYRTRAEMPKRLETAIMKRNNPDDQFLECEWIVKENPSMSCFSCTFEVPLNFLINRGIINVPFERIINKLMKECYWYYDNVQSLDK